MRENMDYTIVEYARNLAARFWFLNNSIKIETIAQEWEIRVDDVYDILRSKAYRVEVEKLIRTPRSPRNLQKWIELYYSPSGLARRMRLSETVVSEIVERIKQNIRR